MSIERRKAEDPEVMARMTRETHSILMVDDDARDRRVVTRALETAGIEVTSVADRAAAVEMLGAHGAYNLAILDVDLPDANGVELCHELSAQYDMPIIMLTAVSDERDAVHALDSGADDYVRKPFSARELIARVRSVLRRSHRDDALDGALNIGRLTLDSHSYRALIDGEPLPLTPTEYRLLAFLAQNVGRVMTRDELLQFVWGAGYEGEHHMLHVTVSRLRQKLGRVNSPSLIRTTPGIGYEFVAVPA
jgi:DNA-binding response OmpR family regulator